MRSCFFWLLCRRSSASWALAPLVAEQLRVLGLGDLEGTPVAGARMILDVLLDQLPLLLLALAVSLLLLAFRDRWLAHLEDWIAWNRESPKDSFTLTAAISR